MENMLKALFVFKIFSFLFGLFGFIENRLDKKTKVNSKIYGVTDWKANNCNLNSIKARVFFGTHMKINNCISPIRIVITYGNQTFPNYNN